LRVEARCSLKVPKDVESINKELKILIVLLVIMFVALLFFGSQLFRMSGMMSELESGIERLEREQSDASVRQ
jgi:hypothetical protein